MGAIATHSTHYRPRRLPRLVGTVVLLVFFLAGCRASLLPTPAPTFAKGEATALLRRAMPSDGQGKFPLCRAIKDGWTWPLDSKTKVAVDRFEETWSGVGYWDVVVYFKTQGEANSFIPASLTYRVYEVTRTVSGFCITGVGVT